MRQDEARRCLIAEWRDWLHTNGRPAIGRPAMARFFGWLKKERFYLLQFESEGEKLDTVQAWLEEHEAANAKQPKRQKRSR